MISPNFPLKTKITLTNWNTFNREVSSIPMENYVKDWTKEGIIKANDGFTSGVKNCVSAFLTDGQAVIAHICPTESGNVDFNEIKKTICDKIGEKTDNLLGFLLGSVSHYKDSKDLFKNFKDFFENTLKIPYSYMRGHTIDSIDTSVAYKAEKKTIFVTNDFISMKTFYKKPPSTYLDNAFEEMKIDPLHELIID